MPEFRRGQIVKFIVEVPGIDSGTLGTITSESPERCDVLVFGRGIITTDKENLFSADKADQ